MNIDEIGKIAKLMKDYDLTQFSLESDDMCLKMKRGGKAVAVSQAVAPTASVAAPAPAAAGAADQSNESGKNPPAEPCETIDSPIVGTFYSAATPEAKAFVDVGDEVDEDTVVCIVEAMKVMNEIKAEKRGVIRRVLVDNATPVEFGQPMFEIETL